MVHDCWLVLSVLFLQTVLTSRGPDGGLRVAPSHGSLRGGSRAYRVYVAARETHGRACPRSYQVPVTSPDSAQRAVDMPVPCSPAAGALSTTETPGVTAWRALLLFEELQPSPARLVGSCSGPAASADAHLPRRAHELGSGGAAARKLREALTVVRPP